MAAFLVALGQLFAIFWKHLRPPKIDDNGHHDLAYKAQRLARNNGLYLWKLFWSLCLAWGCLWFGYFALFEGVPAYGKVAWIAEVDAKIQGAIAPLMTEQSELKDAIKEQTALSRQFLAEAAERELRKTIELWCAERSLEVRERYERDFDRLTSQWRLAREAPFGAQWRTLTRSTCQDFAR